MEREREKNTRVNDVTWIQRDFLLSNVRVVPCGE